MKGLIMAVIAVVLGAETGVVDHGLWKERVLRSRGMPEKPFMKMWAEDNSEAVLSAERPANKYVVERLPESYDPRERHPECILRASNQLSCGSCWAESVTKALGERLCRATGGLFRGELSTQSLVDCNRDGSSCEGGRAAEAWVETMEDGVPLGVCQPYRGRQGQCQRGCVNALGSGVVFSESVHWADAEGKSGRERVKEELVVFGPVTGTIVVREDFTKYKEGIYVEQTGEWQTPHSVRIVGYGKERVGRKAALAVKKAEAEARKRDAEWRQSNRSKSSRIEVGVVDEMSNDEDGDGNGAEDETEEIGYWLCVNSWGKQWGDEGFFKIREGAVKKVQFGYPRVSVEDSVQMPQWAVEGGKTRSKAGGARGDGVMVPVFGRVQIGSVFPDRISVDVVEQRRGRGERECGDVKARFAVKGANMFKTPHLQCRLDNVMSSGVEWVSPSEIVCVFSSLKDSWVLCGAGKGVQKERR
ncbi:putative cathepsin B2 cysteine protease [Monocercomonoides exilis]|uniref:putative cathepsin B2 cysteine protease n=1 Tax=Monocercomonoides exilis TaxID=2049356 RepID=UPI003559B353|nr:putative cathepsin B2 cysteine protease [Monocercomonoides exilis]|eukprot:MONOS_13756.1-p1 / transcript=MONOS_13756.1 / gene=MONOS_13756 / organism=Monocercomonoides_exilis_PA203 / gene_product=cathepsin B2 cysteine protease / transcript_product=cathepsin B2 cysteine protease / location=Mono_scaffold00877:18594-20153(-) / protein_length=472 / sequence_SO=supercontig / SO=protein_coding / is_pseudo=false